MYNLSWFKLTAKIKELTSNTVNLDPESTSSLNSTLYNSTFAVLFSVEKCGQRFGIHRYFIPFFRTAGTDAVKSDQNCLWKTCVVWPTPKDWSHLAQGSRKEKEVKENDSKGVRLQTVRKK